MLNSDKLQKLYRLASGKEPNPLPKNKLTANKEKLSKAKKEFLSYSSAYSDPLDAWNKWIEKQIPDITSEESDELWNEAEKKFPGNQEQARTAIREKLREGITARDPSAREQQLRNTAIKSPSWFVPELEEELKTASVKTSTQNVNKAKAIYLTSLENKIKNFNFSELDPDVPAEVHIEEMVKLEAMGLLETAKIVNGRLAVTNQSGAIQPAFAVTQEAEISGALNLDSPELQTILQLAPTVFKKYVEPALQESQDSIALSNRASSGAALGMLRSGNLPVDRWHEALSLINENPRAGIDEGIAGLVSANPMINEEDAAKYSMDIMSNYGGML